MPRLELLAAVLLSKLIVSTKSAVERVLKVTDIFCWCDSQIVLWWLKLQQEWKLRVENRVRIVRRNALPENWFYVPTNPNPADVATRVRSPSSFSSCLLWWQGPKFLYSREIKIPNQQFLEPDMLPEVKCTATVGLVGNDTIVG